MLLRAFSKDNTVKHVVLLQKRETSILFETPNDHLKYLSRLIYALLLFYFFSGLELISYLLEFLFISWLSGPSLLLGLIADSCAVRPR